MHQVHTLLDFCINIEEAKSTKSRWTLFNMDRCEEFYRLKSREVIFSTYPLQALAQNIFQTRSMNYSDPVQRNFA